MKPLPAVGLASSIIQNIDFSVKITSKDNIIYQPAEGDQIDNSTILQNVANNLFRLSLNLEQNDLKKLSSDPKRPKLSEAAEQMLKLSDETKELTTTLVNAVLQAQARGAFSDPKWQTVREALSTVWKKKEITGIKKKLKGVRKDVDAVLMVALRQYLDQSAETGLPVFSEENGRIHHVEKWQNEAMDQIHANDWKAKNKKHLEEFSKHVDALVQAEKEAVFCDDIFKVLHFPAMNDRMQSIEPAHQGHYQWFSSMPLNGQPGDNFLAWLSDTSGHNLYWVTGQPGSGKSTMMKHLFRNPLLIPSLEEWSGAKPGIIAGFSFWSCGTELQNSSTGMLRALLYESLQDMIYGPLQKEPGMIQWLFSDRWQQFATYGGGMQALTFQDLRRSFDLMISDITKKFFFLVDGLDELEGYPEAIIDLLTSVTKRNNVKVAVSTRKSPAFQGAFEGRPSFELNLHTKHDIQSYLSYLFGQDEKWVKICTEMPDGTPERDIIGGLVEKANGIFLWATLSAEFLIQGMDESDDISTLFARVQRLPSDLNSLLQHIFSSLDRTDLEQAARLFRLVDAHGYPDIVELSFAFDSNTQSSIAAEIRPLSVMELTKRVDGMYSILRFQTKNLLGVFEASQESDDDSQIREKKLKVTYAHKAFRDFIQSEEQAIQILHATKNETFSTDECWANASLWALKTSRLQTDAQGNTRLPIWGDLVWCIEYALRLEETDRKVRVTYLDEVGRAAIGERKENVKSNETDLPEGASTESFMDIAVWLNLAGYVSIKAKSAERKELRHAIEYFRTMRKRLGTGGEDKYIGGKKKIKAAHDATTPELFQLLEYYAKPLRFASPKPFVEIPVGV